VSARPGPIAKNRDHIRPARTDGWVPGLVAALALADRPEAAALRLVKGHVAANRDGSGDDNDPDRSPPRKNSQQDQSENDPGDPDLHARCHDDSIHLDPPGPCSPRNPAYLLTLEDRCADLAAG
jgi:hypothetical protein